MTIQAAVPPELALDFALAVILSSDTPLLMIDGSLAVLAASSSFCRAFQINPASVNGRQMSELGSGEWDVPQLDSLLKATASGFAEVSGYEMRLQRADRPVRSLVVNAHKVDYPGAMGTTAVRILLSVADVTEARNNEKQKDDLVREKAILLQELQHRVANSLQIIASVPMQSARKVQSEESRGHLFGAHNRVMSVAALQRQLAASSLEDVVLRSYLTDLCRSIGASMIHDRSLVSLDVKVDESIVKADVSISLGLVVTELVITRSSNGRYRGPPAPHRPLYPPGDCRLINGRSCVGQKTFLSILDQPPTGTTRCEHDSSGGIAVCHTHQATRAGSRYR
ncbi:PAS domain-containing protein [Rhizobium leguminosarum]|nr:PAS domain-containing protein [Rhizobium ruizarguesonis]NEJ34378.1 PAS domain-containing protein [Rhizobium ruizarguesonis]